VLKSLGKEEVRKELGKCVSVVLLTQEWNLRRNDKGGKDSNARSD